MKHLFFLIIILTLLLNTVGSCSNKEETSGLLIGNLDVFISYVNVNGTNILQNDSPIEVFYEKEGVAQKVERLNLDYPYGFVITSQRNTASNGSDELCVKIFSSDFLDNQNISTTYVKFDNNPMDTIKCQFYKSSDAFYLLKTWLNGMLVWDKQTALSFPFIKIVK